MKILDRYVLRSWVTIFVLTAIGFPVVSIMINMTDNLERLIARGLRIPEIVVSYFYALPENVFLVKTAGNATDGSPLNVLSGSNVVYTYLVINTGEKAGQSVFHFHAHIIGGKEMGWPPFPEDK